MLIGDQGFVSSVGVDSAGYGGNDAERVDVASRENRVTERR